MAHVIVGHDGLAPRGDVAAVYETRGQRPEHLLVGSTADHCARRAHCPTMIVHPT